MAGNMIIKPKELEKEIEACRTAGKNVAGITMNIEFSYSEMKHLDKLKECGTLLNEILTEFETMIEHDMLSAEKVKGEWMNVDDELANKTFGEFVSDNLFGE